MFDLTNADPMTRGRIEKHLNRLVRYENRIMSQRECYEALRATHTHIGKDQNGKRYYGIRREPDSHILDVPKMLFDRCTLPLYVREVS
jgi:hypothetical protein